MMMRETKRLEQCAQVDGPTASGGADAALGWMAYVPWPSISNALTGVRAKEISKSRYPVFPNFLGLVLGCIEAKFCK